jgi:hypothetical protein
MKLNLFQLHLLSIGGAKQNPIRRSGSGFVVPILEREMFIPM